MQANPIHDVLIKAWVKRISDKMVLETSSSVDFVVGKDIKPSEEDWLRTVLLPALIKDYGMTARFVLFNPKGAVPSCDCHSQVCQHSEGLIFRVLLQAAK